MPTTLTPSSGNSQRMISRNADLFRSTRPMGFAGGDTNLTRYVGNSPTNYTDPTGNQAVVPPNAGPPFYPPTGTAEWTPRRPGWLPDPGDPRAQRDLEELVELVYRDRREVPWIDPCFTWASGFNLPSRYDPKYGGPDKSKITVVPVYWFIDRWGPQNGDHAAFKVTYPDGTVLYFDDGRPYSEFAGALGGRDRWFCPADIPSNYLDEGPNATRPHRPGGRL